MELDYDKFILFGDSITERIYNRELGSIFGNELHAQYVRKLDIINRGYGGYNSDQGLAIIPHIIESEKKPDCANIKLMTIFFGTNDSANTYQNVPLERYKSNMFKIVEIAVQNDIKPIVVGTSLSQDLGTSAAVPPKSNAVNLAYSKAAKEVADHFNVPFVDLWNAFRLRAMLSEDQLVDPNFHSDLSLVLADSLHYSREGYKIFYDELMGTIRKSYPELAPENLPRKLLNYTDFYPQAIQE